MNRRPPLVVSPRRLRPRRELPPRHPAPPPSKNSPVTNAKAIHPLRASVSGASLFRPESDLVSSELLAMTKNAKEEEFKENLYLYQESEKENRKLFSPTTPVAQKSATSPLFERGRFYDLYSARRNERLRRRQLELLGETEAVEVIQNPAVAVELKKKTSKKNESARKSISGDFSVSRIPTLRSAVRTSKDKDIRKSTSSLGFDEKSSVCTSTRRISTRSSARRF
ncbi:hypothetical protein LUZ61_018140 [Rhynchospora tenuis]|uniref:Uncharacterized protein n=1 Tax=Rhynchospora tenuis TaxID=198213 RepID=A0AAD5Z8U4_9POAL|nr:hypothetical protein LUZ61_018140 [Rhynchospora tenuis]